MQMVKQKARLGALALLMGFGSTEVASKTSEPLEELSGSLSSARTYFRRHEYRKALSSLTAPDDDQSLLISAESYFRLGEYAQSKKYFEEFQAQSTDPLDKKKVAIRLFDVELLAGNIDSALKSYEVYQERYQVPARMAYALGKALFDRKDFEKAKDVLDGIGKDNEYSLRASYILSALEIGLKDPRELLKMFNEIENALVISVEDHAVHDLAILAQARILVDMGREDLAESVYSRVSTKSGYFAEATYELASAWVSLAERAQAGLGSFKDQSDFSRQLTYEKALDSALAAVKRFQKLYQVDWRMPKLSALMADLLVKSKRYEEAKVAYDKLFEHYDAVREKLKTDELWSTLSLSSDTPGLIFEDVPAEIMSSNEAKDLFLLRTRLLDSQESIKRLEELSKINGINSPALKKAWSLQKSLEESYRLLALEKQKGLSEKLIARLNRELTEAEFKRAQMVLAQNRDIEKQLRVVEEYQAKKTRLFESSLKAIDKSGAQ